MAMAMAMHLLDSPKDIRYGSHSNQDNHQLWSDGMGRICNLLLMGPGIWDLEVWCVTSEMSQRARASLLQLFCQRLVPAPGCGIGTAGTSTVQSAVAVYTSLWSIGSTPGASIPLIARSAPLHRRNPFQETTDNMA